eukprot:m.46196 g.46196  ORF g.46196 m.46196 type:complete len:140 (+) comp10715_c0_seq1:1-420(+)
MCMNVCVCPRTMRLMHSGLLVVDASDQDLYDFFKEAGVVDGVRIVRDKKLSVGLGFGYVAFKSVSSVGRALTLAGKTISDRPIRVKRCTPSTQVASMAVKGKKSNTTTSSSSSSSSSKKHAKKVVVLDHRGKKPRHKAR